MEPIGCRWAGPDKIEMMNSPKQETVKIRAATIQTYKSGCVDTPRAHFEVHTAITHVDPTVANCCLIDFFWMVKR